ncbi:MAG: hypothetical protein A2552_09975 [Sulfuricurvum sp. RIFOXYD2_FULL_44_160]|uniref:Uncharacterized protein n=1 Tax=Sulfuricurvum kujiense TaxID=148813 RepID=A0A2D3WHU1_9BACT|nr:MULTISPECIES: ankyrin repeat domain-containing protein [Sulfuricurvum]OHD91497.1 MAG: hypothetical protein A2552_09975 [Sulfuricurvum sp. RIFOXYD2_FULL_44_160]OHD91733.1 MAG: hypothetical protein A2517_06485 [Sulfuricurvum sp. RIFOXYD12_FULL_44_77]DAB38630.1 MAG TPA: hypothetical protein CFH83_04905 [Sulfuricurvum kujiense]
MKKVFIGIVLIFGILMATKQLMHKDYSSAKQLADSGNYQAFYTGIKEDVAKGDKDAANLLMDYFLKAVQDGDIAEAKYYLDQDRSLIDKTDKDGARAIDAALFGDVIQIETMKFLLEYQPELNYEISYFKNMSLLQMIASNSHLSKGDELAKYLIEHGANVNFYNVKGESSNSPLLLSYSSDNFETFKVLIQNGANIKDDKFTDDKHDLLGLIAGSYVLELNKNFPNIKAIYSTPLSSEVISIVQSQTYRTIHSRNMAYLALIFQTKKITDMDLRGLSKLAQYYAATNEIDGMKLLVNYGLCNNQKICTDAIQKAMLNNNRAILSILKGN